MAPCAWISRRGEPIFRRLESTIVSTLAAAYAETGQFSEALAAAEKGLNYARAQGDATMAAALQSQILHYQAGSPVRDGGTAS